MPKFLISIGLVSIGLASAILIWAQMRSDNKWKKIAADSDIIVVGLLDKNISSVIRADEFKSQKNPSNSNIVDLPNPDRYMVGAIYGFNVSQYLKLQKEDLVAEKISVFIPGRFPKHGDAVLITGNKYVLFLHKLKESGSFTGTTVLQINSDYSSEQKPFDPTSAYSVVSGEYGAINIDSNQGELIKEIEAAIK